MCCSCLCDIIYSCRCCLFKLLIPLWIVDIIFTSYVLHELFTGSIDACCTNNNINDCSNDDIARTFGIDNVSINNGLCVSNNPSMPCGDSFITCANNNGYGAMANELCSESTLNKLANNVNMWVVIVLFVKLFGLVFLISYEMRNCCKFKNDKSKVDEAEAEELNCCDKCGNSCVDAGKKCVCNTVLLITKMFFLIFGTVVTFLFLWYLRLTGNVLPGTCKLVGDLRSDCELLESSICTNSDNENFYNVLFYGLDLRGPAWVNMTLNVMNTIIWFVRLAVMRYFLKATHLADV